MNTHCTLQLSFECTYHPWPNDQANHHLKRRTVLKEAFIHCANFVENASSATMNYSNICVRLMRIALFAKVKEFVTNSKYDSKKKDMEM